MLTGDELADLIRRLAKERDEYMTVREAADYMRQTIATIHGWIRSGRLMAAAPTAGKHLVRKKDLDAIWRRAVVDPDEQTPLRDVRAANMRKAIAAKRARGTGADVEKATDEQEVMA